MTEALPPSLAANPRLGDWLRIGPDGTIEIRSGKVELGQGVLTALAQIAAEELDVDASRVRATAATTDLGPDEGFTAGSLSIQHSGAAVREVCAEAREIYLAAAAAKLAVPTQDLTIRDGRISARDGATTSYWELADDALLDRAATGDAAPKPESEYRVVGSNAPRLDLPDKFTGRPHYIHDLDMPELAYGRVVRPPSRGATLRGVDTEPTLALPGVIAVARDGDFLGVVAEREEVALHAADRLRRGASWDQRATLPDENAVAAFLTSAPADTTVLAERADGPPSSTARSITAAYHRPYLAHGSIGPSSATALATADGRLEVWSHSQGIHPLRRELARALGVAVDRVVVRHVEGAGCYGHNGADDVAMDAALLALAAPGRPVQVVWSRQDELGWAPFGPAGVMRLSAALADDGTVQSWRHEIWSGSFVSRPGTTPTSALLAASHRRGGEEIRAGGEPPLQFGGGAGRNAVPGYDFPAYRVVNHLVTAMPLRTSALRSLGAFGNVFAAESFMDELAAAAGRDPLDYRLAQLSDPRGRAVLAAAARNANWTRWTPSDGHGHGIGYARYKNSSAYCAVVAEVEAVSEVRVRRLTIAVDAGLVISPDGVINQIEGGAIQSTSWALKERVRFDRFTVTSDTWESYPILRFSEVPAVDVELLPGSGNPPLGVGECAQGPTAAAIANAVCDALGVRVRSLPLTFDQIVAAMPG
ncbi:xanthine dehydrogenase family protein molybdopterin-binding subunit [Mycobacterium sp.]|jgi:CO/xanthine dehydrogenase Mo-binding subunit|uniref:xanthine dehydrogenase family protein molybdopterin-binding subunit n=1 Tax=Mycobacterium sp. TaxID=1785 RepID=UPI002D595200|nr:molybdopterin cofactor-binding domain-containing protein [Mycobacterium sp.]HZA09551.1 molybdopterin cofactor-binding domain-containing protein [Mycobacterium sp.]